MRKVSSRRPIHGRKVLNRRKLPHPYASLLARVSEQKRIVVSRPADRIMHDVLRELEDSRGLLELKRRGITEHQLMRFFFLLYNEFGAAQAAHNLIEIRHKLLNYTQHFIALIDTVIRVERDPELKDLRSLGGPYYRHLFDTFFRSAVRLKSALTPQEISQAEQALAKIAEDMPLAKAVIRHGNLDYQRMVVSIAGICERTFASDGTTQDRPYSFISDLVNTNAIRALLPIPPPRTVSGESVKTIIKRAIKDGLLPVRGGSKSSKK